MLKVLVIILFNLNNRTVLQTTIIYIVASRNKCELHYNIIHYWLVQTQLTSIMVLDILSSQVYTKQNNSVSLVLLETFVFILKFCFHSEIDIEYILQDQMQSC